jgi:hypothetical protein
MIMAKIQRAIATVALHVHQQQSNPQHDEVAGGDGGHSAGIEGAGARGIAKEQLIDAKVGKDGVLSQREAPNQGDETGTGLHHTASGRADRLGVQQP